MPQEGNYTHLVNFLRLRGRTNAFYFSEESVRFLGYFLDLTRTKTLGFFIEVCQILKSNFPRFKPLSVMLKIIL